MGDRTGIEWANATWNPLTGCSRVSPGCDHCYAERQTATRLAHVPAYAGLTEGGGWTGEVREVPDRLGQPLRWRRPRRIFVNSMSDLFHPGVSFDYQARVFAVMGLARQHTFQVLTKRPQRMAEVLSDRTFWELVYRKVLHGTDLPPNPAALSTDGFFVQGGRLTAALPNVWLGTSIESQAYAFRARHLLGTPAAVRFVSAEPLLGPLDLDGYYDNPAFGDARIDWVITGGESGPGARPTHPDWVRAIRDQCQDAEVSFLHKQWGEWVGPQFVNASGRDGKAAGREITIWPDGRTATGEHGTAADGAHTLWRVGKHAAGRTLDGRLWDEYPA